MMNLKVPSAFLIVLLSTNIVWAGNWSTSGSASVTEITIKSGYVKNASHKKEYGIQSSADVVRAGKRSQRFEIRHGDCSAGADWSDCDNDRRRIERAIELQPSKVINKITWVGYSLYIPKDFPDVAPSNTAIGQIKMVGYRHPMWIMTAANRTLTFSASASEQKCNVNNLEDILGTWLDIQIGVDWSTQKNRREGAFNSEFAEIWVNGKHMNDCYFPEPLLTEQMIKSRAKKWDLKFHFDWGIYNAFPSLWLAANKTRDPGVKEWRDDYGNGRSSESAAKNPWAVDWGVQFPTMVLYYDEMRIGPDRNSVDVNLQKNFVD